MDAIELLTHFNLTKQEATIYLTLVASGELTGYEAAKLTCTSRSNAYTALAGLVDKGAARVIEGTSTKYTPVTVKEFCTNRIRRMQGYRDELLHQVSAQKGEPDGYITIKGSDHIIDKMKTMLDDARRRVYLSLSEDILRKVLPEIEGAVRRGLKVVLITNPPFELPGARVYHTAKNQPAIRLIADSGFVLTGDIAQGAGSTCLYSRKKNLVDLFKESMKNEIELIELTAEKAGKM